MATSTTNLGLTKPAGTDKIRIAQINGNMDILDEKIGAVGNTSLQAQITSQNEAIVTVNNKLNHYVGDNGVQWTYTSGNLNDIKYPGRYYVTSDCTNIPFSGASGYLDVYCYDSNRVAQTFRQFNDCRVFERRLVSGTWSDWQDLALKSDVVQTSTDIGGGCKHTAIGKMRVLSFTNNSGSVTTDGIQLPETAAFATCSPCIYFNGTTNVDGELHVSYSKVYVTNKSLIPQAATYVQGQVIYFVS